MVRITVLLATAAVLTVLAAGGAKAQSRDDSVFCNDRAVTNVAMWTCVKLKPAALRFTLAMSGSGLAITWVLWCEGYQPYTRTIVPKGTRLLIQVSSSAHRQVYARMRRSRICRFTLLIQAPSSPTAPRPLTLSPHWFSR